MPQNKRAPTGSSNRAIAKHLLDVAAEVWDEFDTPIAISTQIDDPNRGKDVQVTCFAHGLPGKLMSVRFDHDNRRWEIQDHMPTSSSNLMFAGSPEVLQDLVRNRLRRHVHLAKTRRTLAPTS